MFESLGPAAGWLRQFLVTVAPTTAEHVAHLMSAPPPLTDRLPKGQLSHIVQPFELLIHGTQQTLAVARFRGTESIGSLYSFHLRAVMRLEMIGSLRKSLLGEPVTLRVSLPDDGVRTLHGVVATVRAGDAGLNGTGALDLEIRPRMDRMRRRRTYRVFQNLTAREIVESVLALASVDFLWLAGRPLARRSYATQYDETDFDFVSRLLAEEGLTFHFDHVAHVTDQATPHEVLIVTDDPSQRVDIEGKRYLEFTGAEVGALSQTDDQIQWLAMRDAMEPDAVMTSAYDLRRPMHRPVDVAALGATPQAGTLGDLRSFVDATDVIHEHDGGREEAPVLALPASIALESLRARASVAEGRSTCRRMASGRRFTLFNHIVPELDGDYVVVRVDHEAHAGSESADGRPAYQNHFEVVPASVPYRMPVPKRAVRQSLETATVVGPVGKEIHVDSLGRVKVRFRWDLTDPTDALSSCWLRVAHMASGPGWGSQFVPRVGTEVLVGYVGGDPDRPIVMGTLYNGAHLPPFTLPEENTVSGFRSRSSPGGVGANEIVFDDRAGEELLRLRSQRDVVINALANITSEAGSARNELTGGTVSRRIGGDHEVAVAGSQSSAVEGDTRSSVDGNVTELLKSDRSTDLAGDDSRVVGGRQTTLIGGSSHTAIGTKGQPVYAVTTVNGGHRTSAIKEIELFSRERITLRVGETVVQILPGSVTIQTGSFEVNGTRVDMSVKDGAGLTLDGGVKLVGDPIVLAASASSLHLAANAELRGGQVHLGSGADAAVVTAGGVSDERGIAVFRFKGIDPETAQDISVFITGPDGAMIERTLDSSCVIEIEGRPGDRFVVTEVRRGSIVLAATAPKKKS